MPGTFVVGHGAYYVEGADTFVPNGMTVHLYANEGEGIPAPNVIEILRYRGGGSVRTIQAGEPIKNLILQKLSESQFLSELGAVQPGELVCFVGYDAPADGAADYTLCMSTCDVQQGIHGCGGIFALFAGVAELHLLCCMEKRPGGMDDRENLPWENQPDHYTRIQDLAGEIAAEIGYVPDSDTITDYENADAASSFDALSREDQAKLMTYEPIQRWSYVRYARQLKQQLDLPTFQAWCAKQEPWAKAIYQKDTDVLGPYFT